ncbi:MAG: ABC transporter substrate-binding protein [candidate division Zixibacteria bacterium]|nr:ABC transporter substrate-binding protein [candidate division Zixibacteria bacterium]
MTQKNEQPTRFNKLTRVFLVFSISVFAFLAISTSLTYAKNIKKIGIIAIDEDRSTSRTIKGIKKALKSAKLTAEYHKIILVGNPAIDSKTLADLSAFGPHLVITIGSYATMSASKHFKDIPIIFATVMNPMASGFVASMNRPGGHITGAALDIPPNIQFKYFERVVGQIKSIGVLYSEETANIIGPARVAAKQLGITLEAVQVNSEKAIPQAIDSLCQIVDAFWSVADHTIYTPHSTQYIILQTLRYRIPMMGFSSSLVEAGGLFTLDFDFKDIGRQAGEIASRVLYGTPPGKIPVSTPGAGVIYFKYNEKTATQIQVKIPEELLAIAKEVIR